MHIGGSRRIRVEECTSGGKGKKENFFFRFFILIKPKILYAKPKPIVPPSVTLPPYFIPPSPLLYYTHFLYSFLLSLHFTLPLLFVHCFLSISKAPSHLLASQELFVPPYDIIEVAIRERQLSFLAV